MADGIIGLVDAATPTKKLDTTELTVGSNTVERERMVISGSTATALVEPVAANTAAAANQVSLPVTLSPNGAEVVGAAGTLNALNAAATIFAAGQEGVGFQLAAGTLIGTIVPECSLDGGTTWVATMFDDPVTGNKVTSIVFGSANTATARSLIGVSGASNYRVRVSAFTSGTASCTMRASTVDDPTVLFSGAAGSTPLPPTVAQVGGSDGTNLRAILTDTAGRQVVALPDIAATPAPSVQTVGTTSGSILAANAARKQILIVNCGTTTIYLGFGQTPTAASYHWALAGCSGSAHDGTGEKLISDVIVQQVNAISSLAGGLVNITELT